MTMATPSATTKAVPVRLHRFASGREYTVGIEEELMLVDATTFALRAGVEPILAAWADEHVKPELMQCQVEIATAPQRTAREALADLGRLRRRVIATAAAHDLRPACAGTHPFSNAEEQPITTRDRYRELIAALRYPARRELCFGMHVHVAVAGADKALRVIEALLGDLAVLVALSTSSPFWRGEPTGLYSTRTIVFQSLPRTGLPPAFAGYEEYARSVEHLQAAGAIADHSYLWWDVRPHPRFGTVEVRCLDVQPRAVDGAALAGLVQALVRHYGRRYDRGERFADANRLIAAENRWLAARHGLHAHLVDLESDAAIPARQAVDRLLDRVESDAAALDASWALEAVERICRDGTSAERQLKLHRHGASLPEIVRALADETAEPAA